MKKKQRWWGLYNKLEDSLFSTIYLTRAAAREAHQFFPPDYKVVELSIVNEAVKPSVEYYYCDNNKTFYRIKNNKVMYKNGDFWFRTLDTDPNWVRNNITYVPTKDFGDIFKDEKAD